MKPCDWLTRRPGCAPVFSPPLADLPILSCARTHAPTSPETSTQRKRETRAARRTAYRDQGLVQGVEGQGGHLIDRKTPAARTPGVDLAPTLSSTVSGPASSSAGEIRRKNGNRQRNKSSTPGLVLSVACIPAQTRLSRVAPEGCQLLQGARAEDEDLLRLPNSVAGMPHRQLRGVAPACVYVLSTRDSQLEGAGSSTLGASGCSHRLSGFGTETSRRTDPTQSPTSKQQGASKEAIVEACHCSPAHAFLRVRCP